MLLKLGHFMVHRTIAALIAAAALAGAFALVQAQAMPQQPPTQTVVDPVYTQNQAARDEELFAANCARCHEGVCPDGPPLTGPLFVERWRDDSLAPLLTFMKGLPPVLGGVLKENEYVDVIAFLMQSNEFPAGSRELTAESLGRIQF